MKYKVWSKDKKSHIWAFINFQEETKARLIEYDRTRPPVAGEIIVIYETKEIIKEEVFDKHGLSYQILDKN